MFSLSSPSNFSPLSPTQTLFCLFSLFMNRSVALNLLKLHPILENEAVVASIFIPVLFSLRLTSSWVPSLRERDFFVVPSHCLLVFHLHLLLQLHMNQCYPLESTRFYRFSLLSLCNLKFLSCPQLTAEVKRKSKNLKSLTRQTEGKWEANDRILTLGTTSGFCPCFVCLHLFEWDALLFFLKPFVTRNEFLAQNKLIQENKQQTENCKTTMKAIRQEHERKTRLRRLNSILMEEVFLSGHVLCYIPSLWLLVVSLTTAVIFEAVTMKNKDLDRRQQERCLNNIALVLHLLLLLWYRSNCLLLWFLFCRLLHVLCVTSFIMMIVILMMSLCQFRLRHLKMLIIGYIPLLLFRDMRSEDDLPLIVLLVHDMRQGWVRHKPRSKLRLNLSFSVCCLISAKNDSHATNFFQLLCKTQK